MKVKNIKNKEIIIGITTIKIILTIVIVVTDIMIMIIIKMKMFSCIKT